MLRRSVAITILFSMSGLVAAAQPPSDASSAITKADEAFCQAVADRNVGRFRALLAEDAVFSGGTPTALHGRDAIADAWAPYFEPDGPRLSWKPEKAEVLPAGDVGYTVGAWERRAKSADGKPTVARGHYVTMWRKQADGVWRAVFDTGGEDPR